MFQAVSDVERGWVVAKPDALKELNNLKAQNSKKKVNQLFFNDKNKLINICLV